jgi:hypothetical protein
LHQSWGWLCTPTQQSSSITQAGVNDSDRLLKLFVGAVPCWCAID